jgi:CheY-like chemotaxis protein
MSMERPSLLVLEREAHRPLAHSIVREVAGCSVRAAVNGVAALAEMQYDLPDILVADLDLSGRDLLSGCELLSHVGQMYPSIRVIAIGAETDGDSIPPNITADAFHGKGSSRNSLIDLVTTMARQTRQSQRQTPVRTPSARRLELVAKRSESARENAAPDLVPEPPQERKPQSSNRMALVS